MNHLPLSVDVLLDLLGYGPREGEELDMVLRTALSELVTRRRADGLQKSRDREDLNLALKDVREYFDSHCTGFGTDCDLPHTSFDILERMLMAIAAAHPAPR